jgi:hypothetical protein
MKTLAQIITILAATFSMVGCASTKAYFIDRGRDAADIFTVTVGVGLGAKARIGPVHAGLFANAEGYGLRGGQLGCVYDAYHEGGFTFDIDTLVIPTKDSIGLFGAEILSLTGDNRGKQFEDQCNIPFIYSLEPGGPNWTLIEIVVAAGPSLRLGFNPGELLDFFLGWFGIDIYDDDVEMNARKEVKKSNKVPEATARKLAGPQH